MPRGMWPLVVACCCVRVETFHVPARGLCPRVVRARVMEEKQSTEVDDKAASEREKMERALMEEWAAAWEDEKAQEGFDWEMEKLRRKLEEARARRPSPLGRGRVGRVARARARAQGRERDACRSRRSSGGPSSGGA